MPRSGNGARFFWVVKEMGCGGGLSGETLLNFGQHLQKSLEFTHFLNVKVCLTPINKG